MRVPRQVYETNRKETQREKINQIMKDRGGKWISGNYTGVSSSLYLMCNDGHKWVTKAGNTLNDRWCPVCAKAYQNQCIRAIKLFRKINKEIEYHNSGQYLFDKINAEIKRIQKEVKRKRRPALEREYKKKNSWKYKEKARESYHNNYHNDNDFRLNALLRTQFKKCLIKDREMGKYYKLLGYTTADLVLHLQSLFTDGMTWDNIGEWHIDHKRPKSWFNLHNGDGAVNEEQVKACWGLNNLQPLWGADNMSKGNRWEG